MVKRAFIISRQGGSRSIGTMASIVRVVEYNKTHLAHAGTGDRYSIGACSVCTGLRLLSTYM